MSRVSIGVNDHLAERVVRSPFYLKHCADADMLTIAEYAIDCDYVGGLFGGAAGKDRVTPFACLVFRVLILTHSPSSSSSSSSGGASPLEFLQEFISQPHHKYLRVFGIICMRLLSNRNIASAVSAAAATAAGQQQLLFAAVSPPLRAHFALDVGFLDYRRVRVMEPDGTVRVTTVDQVCNMLLFSQNSSATATVVSTATTFYGLSLPPFPSRRQILELHPDQASKLMHL